MGEAVFMDELAILDELEDVVYLTDPDTYEVYFINRAGLKNRCV